MGPIEPTRGLRQGDPLSPYLFLIYAEGLSALIQQRERQGFIHGRRIPKQAPSISHLFFTDDSLLLFRANDRESAQMKVVLSLYKKASGQSINFQKSTLSFSSNVPEAD